MTDHESIFAATVIAALILISKNFNDTAENILNDWLKGNESNRTWESINNILPIMPFSRGKARIFSLSLNLRRELHKFLSSHINEPSALLGELRLACSNEDEIKKKGMIFTPLTLVNHVTNEALMHWRRLHRSGRLPKIIGDVSCGIGAFPMQMQRLFSENTTLIAIDSDQLSISFTTLLCAATGNNWEIQCCDPLIECNLQRNAFKNIKTQQYHLLIGNPPYVRSQLLDHRYRMQLKQSYPDSTKGNFDLSILFIEHALRSLVPGGIASYILSNKFMTSSYGRDICHKLATEARIINVSDFYDSQLFPGRTTYTCILTFTKLPPAKRFTVSRAVNNKTSLQTLSLFKSYTLPIQRLLEHPWGFATGSELKILQKLRDKKHPLLTEVFGGILQGVRTGANHIFVLKRENKKVDRLLLQKFVSGAEIRACRIDSELKALLFPYRENAFGLLEPYNEEELKTKYPKTWEYLYSYRDLLGQRDLDPRSPWYAFSRNQNLDIIKRKKLLVREMMPRAEFAADLKGEIAFCSGYALIAEYMSEDELRLWTSIFCTPTMEFALRNNGTQLHSGWYRLLKHHLRITRLPKFDNDKKSDATKLALNLYKNPHNKKLWNKLDTLVASAFNLTKEEHQYLKKFISECHQRSCPNSDKQNSFVSNGSSEVSDSMKRFMPVVLKKYEKLHRDRFDLGQAVTFKLNKSVPIHNWYSFTQGFSEKLVSELIYELDLAPNTKILDPFVGCGTTLLTCIKKGISCTGIEISPLMAWVTKVKTNRWNYKDIQISINKIKNAKLKPYKNLNLPFYDYLSKAFAEQILFQLCGFIQWIEKANLPKEHKDFFKLAVISIMEEISQIRKHGSHYRYLLKSENIGLQKLNIQVVDPETDIKPIFFNRIDNMLRDITITPIKKSVNCEIICGNVKNTNLPSMTFDGVITSPPYLNRNCYIAQQKAEMALLGFINNYQDYKSLVRSTFRSHVESDLDNEPFTSIPEIKKILDAIVLSPNNNKKIPHMIAGYFEDLKSALRELSRLLRPNARMAFVVGNSRWGGVVIPLDHILAKLAEQSGFIVDKILITRLKGNSPQQMRRFGRIPVRESIVVLRKKKY